MSRRDLLVVTRLGLRFGDRPTESPDLFARRLDLLRETSAAFVSACAGCVGWIIETDSAWFDTVVDAVESGLVPLPPSGRTVVSRRGSAHEDGDLARLGLDGRRLLTLRLDSDDRYLHRSVADALRLADELPDGVLVDFPHGYRATWPDRRVRKDSYVMQGPFFGVTMTGVDLDPLHRPHATARLGRPSSSVPGRAWLQHVHTDNIHTEFARRSRFTQLRQLRRDWSRRPPGRSWTELHRFVDDLRSTSHSYDDILGRHSSATS